MMTIAILLIVVAVINNDDSNNNNSSSSQSIQQQQQRRQQHLPLPTTKGRQFVSRVDDDDYYFYIKIALHKSMQLWQRPQHAASLRHMIGKMANAFRHRPGPITSACRRSAAQYRNYTTYPIVTLIDGRFNNNDDMDGSDIPCMTNLARGADTSDDDDDGNGDNKPLEIVDARLAAVDQSVEQCQFRFVSSMENPDFQPSPHGAAAAAAASSSDILHSTVRLDSDVPVGYFDWTYDIMRQSTTNKQLLLLLSTTTTIPTTSMAAAFVSNCGFPKRNQLIRDLQQLRITVDSYGACEHNKDEPGGVRNKTELLRTYLFALAFENSETDDYVTEKFFQALVAGSVPVYLGAGNVNMFAPSLSPPSVISVNQFASTRDLALHLHAVSRDPESYQKYLEWKNPNVGPSLDFVALVDQADRHSVLRRCILIGDLYRFYYGRSGASDQPLRTYDLTSAAVDKQGPPTSHKKKNTIDIYVRERGNYRFIKLIMPQPVTLRQLTFACLKYVVIRTKNRRLSSHAIMHNVQRHLVYGMYTIPDKRPLCCNNDEQVLMEWYTQNRTNVEIEVIFVPDKSKT